jgi:hypothetical protein
MPKPRPKTGEPRVKRQPLKIDLLPQAARDAIQALYDGGRTWAEIAEKSAHPYSAKWREDDGGFVDWEKLDLKVLEHFPEMRLPKTSLMRWYDLRVRQVMAETMRMAAQAREIAAAFAKSAVANGDEAVTNAARDMIMSILARSSAEADRMKAAKELLNLGFLMQTKRANTIKERKVAADERRIKLLEEREQRTREAVDAQTRQAAKKGTGQFSLADINLLRERTFGLPPLTLETPHD